MVFNDGFFIEQDDKIIRNVEKVRIWNETVPVF